MIIDHISFAVKDLEAGISYWSRVFGYRQLTGIVVNSRQHVRVVFLSKEGSITIKLIEPAEGNLSLQNFLNRGGGFHYVCFRCKDIPTTVAELNLTHIAEVSL